MKNYKTEKSLQQDKQNIILKNISEFILNNDNFIITSHINSDGDSIGSELAFAELLLKLNKKYYIYNNDEVSNNLLFLPKVEQVKTNLTDNINSYENLVVLDTDFSTRVGEKIVNSLSHINQNNIVILDHHPNNPINNLSYIDTNASSTGEIIFKLYEYMGVDISENAAFHIYVAIITDTFTLRQANTTAYSHYAVSKIIDKLPIPAHEIVNIIYENEKYSKIKLLGELIANSHFDEENKIITSYLTRENFNKTKTDDVDTENLVNYIRAVKGVEIVILVRENNKGFTNVNLRGKTDEIDLSIIAKKYGGGGHKRAAGFPVHNQDTNVILNNIYNEIKKIKNS